MTALLEYIVGDCFIRATNDVIVKNTNFQSTGPHKTNKYSIDIPYVGKFLRHKKLCKDEKSDFMILISRKPE